MIGGSSSTSNTDRDSIETYLSTPLVDIDDIKAAGGYLKYWQSQLGKRPRLARMALDFLTAPGMSSF